jgi:hypothetical protein
MSHGRIRGYRPPVLPTGPKPGQTPGERGRVGMKPTGPILGPGQHLVLPARTGLANLRDHFDARERPDYEARLKGEVQKPVDPDAMANPAALAPQPGEPPLDFLARMPLAEDEAEPDGSRDDESEAGGAGEPFAPRTIELQGGLFTLADGSLDAEQHPLCTLEALLDGDVPFVSVAVDLGCVPYGLPMGIAALDAAFGRPIPFRAVHQTERTAGAALGYIEICVSEASAELVRALDRPLTVRLG